MKKFNEEEVLDEIVVREQTVKEVERAQYEMLKRYGCLDRKPGWNSTQGEWDHYQRMQRIGDEIKEEESRLSFRIWNAVGNLVMLPILICVVSVLWLLGVIHDDKSCSAFESNARVGIVILLAFLLLTFNSGLHKFVINGVDSLAHQISSRWKDL